jgi:hypothetical protein
VWRIADSEEISDSPHTAAKFSTTDIAATRDWPESRRLCAAAVLRILSQTLPHTAGENTATASFRLRPPLELYFATDAQFLSRHSYRQTIETTNEFARIKF